MEKLKIERKYKTFRLLQHLCLALAFAACVLPMFVSAVRVVPNTPDKGSKVAVGGVALFFIIIVTLILFRSYVKKFVSSLPCTLTVFIAVLAMLLFIVCLKKIIDDAIAVLIVGAIGSFIGVILEIASMLFKMNADDIKERFGRMSDV